MAETKATTPIQFEIDNDTLFQIKQWQLTHQQRGNKIALQSMYPEIMELGMEGYKKKYKL